MSERYSRRDKSHLINLIRRRSGDAPNFALLLGAGASISSGVKPTCEMIDEWRHQLYDQSRSTEPFDKWLPIQDWFKDDEEYSILFDKVYDQPSQRRNYIEECVKDAKPSWGYIYLANVISHNYFNVVFTPNFDDLLNEACFVYADCRPIVCAHDSAVGSIRVTSSRPKIIKLHGDFLYDNIKNTLRETESLEKNMHDKFVQFAKEYGLVVIGYGGNDDSIMDDLDSLVRTEGNFPHGVYWCLKKGSEISRKLDRFLQRQRVCVVEIDGFDEFVAELHKNLGLALPDTVRDPYKATTDRLNRFIQPIEKVSNEIIKKDVMELQARIKYYETIAPNAVIPYEFLASSEVFSGNFEQAAAYYEKALLQDLSVDTLLHLSVVYVYAGKPEKGLEAAERATKLFPNNYRGYYDAANALEHLDIDKALLNYDEALKYAANNKEKEDALAARSNVLLMLNKNEEAISDAEQALKINPKSYVAVMNKGIALKKLGKAAEAKTLVTEVLPFIDSKYHLACAYAILENKKEMLETLKTIVTGGSATERYDFRIRGMIEPDFADYRSDPDFKKLLEEARSGK